MNYFLLFVFLSWISVMPHSSDAQEWDRELYFPDYYFYAERRLVNHTIKTMSVKSLDDCEYLCYKENACVSLNIKNKDPVNGTHKCELNNSTHMENDGDLVNSPIYYYRGAKNNCVKNGQPLCQNNATCQSGFTYKKYRCSCTPGFTGEHCEHDIDKCAEPTPVCDVNAVCNNTRGAYNCTCKPGYTGDGQNCTDIDECASNPCQNNGSCIDSVNGYNCSCLDGFTGKNCETDIDDCASNFCQNNGRCIDGVNGYTCHCEAGFIGTHCEKADACQKYQNLSDAERKESYSSSSGFQCDSTLDGWYRFAGAAGTKIATTCPPESRCGARFPGWMKGLHPTVAGKIVSRNVFFHTFNNCHKNPVNIQVKKCDSFFVYKLSKPRSCDLRYCGAD